MFDGFAKWLNQKCKKIKQIDRFSHKDNNLNSFSLVNHRQFAKLLSHLTFPSTIQYMCLKTDHLCTKTEIHLLPVHDRHSCIIQKQQVLDY